MLKMASTLILILVAGLVYIEAARPGTICNSFAEPELYARGSLVPAQGVQVSALDR